MPYADVDGTRLYYRDLGEGEPLLLIMGFGATWQGWERQIPLLARRYRVIAFDNRGVGRSDKPLGPYTVGQLAKDTRALLDHLQIGAAHVAGLSMGGMIGMELAARYPSRVLSLVLASTTPSADGRLRRFIGKATGRIATVMMRSPSCLLGKGSMEAVQDEVQRIWTPLVFSATPTREERAYLRRMIASAFADGFSPMGTLGQLAACFAHDGRPRLSRIHTRTLVLGGTEDLLFGTERFEELAAGIAGARLEIFAGAPHGLNFAAADAFNEELLRFLAPARRLRHRPPSKADGSVEGWGALR